jgi:hypothetical protein
MHTMLLNFWLNFLVLCLLEFYRLFFGCFVGYILRWWMGTLLMKFFGLIFLYLIFICFLVHCTGFATSIYIN